MVSEVFKPEAERMAEFCLATGLSPNEYMDLTNIELEAFTKVYNKRNK